MAEQPSSHPQHRTPTPHSGSSTESSDSDSSPDEQLESSENISSSLRRPSRPGDRPSPAQQAAPALDKGTAKRAKGVGRGGPPPSPRESLSGASSRTVGQRRKVSTSAAPDTGRGFLPRLARVVEGREADIERRRAVAVPSERTKERALSTRRLRVGEECSPSSKRPNRLRQSSLQRHIDSLATLTNPSLLSVLSGVTNSSSGSNSTITQKSYNKANIAKKKRTKDRRTKKRDISGRNLKTKPSMEYIASATPNVFQYLQTEEDPAPLNANMSDVASDRSVTPEADTNPLHVDISDHVTESPPSSPPPSHSPVTYDDEAPQGDHDHYLEKCHSDSGISMRGSSPEQHENTEAKMKSPPAPRQPQVEEEEESSEEEEGEDDSDDSDDSDDNATDENHNEGGQEHGEKATWEPDQNLALQRMRFTAPDNPNNSQELPAGEERLRRRPEDREGELRHHVLENPQPRRADFRFLAAPSPRPPSVGPYHQQPSGPYDMTPASYYPPPQMASYPPGSMGSAPLVPQYPQYFAPQSQYIPQPTGPDLTKTTVVGYELLANKLTRHSTRHKGSETAVKPLYRKFETLNHRVLLHLQDEISELEEELRYLDEYIAQMSQASGEGNSQVPSRRADARYGGDLHFQRTELLGRIYVKLGQYNQGLSSFSKVNAIDRAREDEVERYRIWAEKRNPIDRSELHFLDRPADLVSVVPPRLPKEQKTTDYPVERPVERAIEQHQHKRLVEPPLEQNPTDQSVCLPIDVAAPTAILGLAVITLLTLFIFTLLPGAGGRLFVTVLVSVAQAAAITMTELSGIMPFKEWIMWGSVYFGFMSVLAGLVR